MAAPSRSPDRLGRAAGRMQLALYALLALGVTTFGVSEVRWRMGAARAAHLERSLEQRANEFLARVGKQLTDMTGWAPGAVGPLTSSSSTAACDVYEAGSGWGGHHLCRRQPVQPCVFYSFGIGKDYSFDVDFAKQTGCRGVAADPTVVHSSVLWPAARQVPALVSAALERALDAPPMVSFHFLAAKSLNDTVNRMWHMVTSVPGMRKWQGHERIAVLKMDCEGCEFSIARDVEAEDPDFFKHVDQFAVEVHVVKPMMPTREHALALGRLYALLHRAGLQLHHAHLGSCGALEAAGCPQHLLELGYPCSRKTMCQNLLFARSEGS